MPNFEVVGDMLTDLQNAIDNQTQVFIRYVSVKGESSERNAAPLELRGDVLWLWDMSKNGLRQMKLNGIESYQVLDDTFDKTQFQS